MQEWRVFMKRVLLKGALRADMETREFWVETVVKFESPGNQ